MESEGESENELHSLLKEELSSLICITDDRRNIFHQLNDVQECNFCCVTDDKRNIFHCNRFIIVE